MSRNEIILRYFFIAALMPMALVLVLGATVVLAALAGSCAPDGTCTLWGFDSTALVARGARLGELFAFAGIWAIGSIAVIAGLSVASARKGKS